MYRRKGNANQRVNALQKTNISTPTYLIELFENFKKRVLKLSLHNNISCCQLVAKVYARTGKNMVRSTGFLKMTIDVDWAVKPRTKQTKIGATNVSI